MRNLIQKLHTYIQKLHTWAGLLTFVNLMVFGLVGLSPVSNPGRRPAAPTVRYEAFTAEPNLTDRQVAERVCGLLRLSLATPIQSAVIQHDSAGNLLLDFWHANGRHRVTVLESEGRLRVEVMRNSLWSYLGTLHATTAAFHSGDWRMQLWADYNEFAMWCLIGMMASGVALVADGACPQQAGATVAGAGRRVVRSIVFLDPVSHVSETPQHPSLDRPVLPGVSRHVRRQRRPDGAPALVSASGACERAELSAGARACRCPRRGSPTAHARRTGRGARIVGRPRGRRCISESCGPALSTEVDYSAATGEAKVTTSTAGFAGMLNRIHQTEGMWHDYGLLNAWAGILGLVSLGLLAIGATGLYLWFRNHAERRIGCVLLAAGAGLAGALIVSMRMG